MRKALLLSTMLAGLAACDLSPDFTLPKMESGDAFKEAATANDAVKDEAKPAVAPAEDAVWKRVDDKAKIEEFAWWRMFKLPALDALEEQAMKDNPSLDMAISRMHAAQAIAGVSESALFPVITAGAGPERQKPAAADINGSFPSPTPIATKPYTTYTAQGVITYELDLFGKNRNTWRAAERDADAEANNYRAARLALQADLAQAYFQYVSLKSEMGILDRTLAARKNALDLNRTKRDVGSIDDLTYATSETDYANVAADRQAVAQQLAVTEHMLATLVGVAPAQFTLSDATLDAAPPMVPAGVPSTLLERRPDIQSAVKQVEAANLRIGAARAGYFPDISLGAVGGYASNTLGDIFKKPNQFWALGPISGGTMLTQTLFDGGLLSSTLDERHAEFDAASAGYRNATLTAFREVEDSLSNVRTLHDQAVARDAALKASKRAYTVAGERYQVGYSSHLDYLDAERNYLAAERSNVQVLGQRYIATVQLVKALGGSWLATPPAAPAVEKKPAEQPAADTPKATDEPQPDAATPDAAAVKAK